MSAGAGRVVLVAVLAATAATQAHAQADPAAAYPGKPLRYIVPWPAGGGGDVLGRAVAQRLAESLGQQIIVDNRAGASGIIGTEAAAKAPPDGYTLLQANTPILCINPGTYAKLPYDPVQSFEPVALVNTGALLVLVHPSVPARSVRELVALSKSRPGQLNYASSGSGTSAHLAGEMFKRAAGVDMVHIPYKGAAPAMIDVIAGQASVMFGDMITALPHVRGGKLRALAVTSGKRAIAAPDIPTIRESGGPELEAAVWSGVLVPRGTPAPVVARLNRALVDIVESQDFRARMIATGGEPLSSTPQQFGQFIRTELARWSQAARDAGARVE